MKKRLIVCIFISIYLIYTHKNRLLINLQEIPYLINIYMVLNNLFELSNDYHHIPEQASLKMEEKRIY